MTDSWNCRYQYNRSQYFSSETNRYNFKLGERGSGLRSRGEVQDFYKLRDQCLANGSLFEDSEFPAVDSSIYYSKSPPRSFQWKRPQELVRNPRLFVEGASRFDVVQGDLGDCWMLAAVANLTLEPKIFNRVVPDDQSFIEKYAGIFHFRFWQYGKWVDVVVDDRLPTLDGQLVFLHSETKNEFWSALLEKAYAKLYGSYESLKGGTTGEAMEDFTGGIKEYFELDKAPPNLFTILIKASERSSLMGCALKPDPSGALKTLPSGLVRGHAYSLTSVKLVDIKTPRMTGKMPLMRVRNPWGDATEWKGPWSDKSREWQFIPADEKEAIGLVFANDGEFWMSFSDFMKNFFTLEVCNLSPDSLEDELDETKRKKWQSHVFEGSWVRGVTAGGCAKYKDTFPTNPQYCVTLEDPDEDDDEDQCTLIVALMQKNRRKQRKLGLSTLSIGFMIYHLKDPKSTPRPLTRNFFDYNLSVGRTATFMNLREISQRFKFPPGTYCIIPSTYDPNEEGDFLLRVFSEKKNDMSEFDDTVGEGEIDQRAEKPAEDAKAQLNLKDSFRRIAGEDLEVDAYELKAILDFVLSKEFRMNGFGINLCRSMVAMMDVDRSGKLGLEEFKELWFSIVTWKNVFKLYEKEHSGTMDISDLRRALNSAGYHLNWHVMNILGLRHKNKSGTIAFEDFIMCAVKLKHMIETFREKDALKTNKAAFTLEEWIEATMYA